MKYLFEKVIYILSWALRHSSWDLRGESSLTQPLELHSIKRPAWATYVFRQCPYWRNWKKTSVSGVWGVGVVREDIGELASHAMGRGLDLIAPAVENHKSYNQGSDTINFSLKDLIWIFLGTCQESPVRRLWQYSRWVMVAGIITAGINYHI